MGRKLFTRPTSRRARKSGQSPYQRHGKAPFAYNAEYQRWRGQFGSRAKKESSNYRGN